MNNEVVVGELELHNITILVLVQELSENVGTLSVRLAPLFSHRVIHTQAQNSFAQLVHDINPENGVNLRILETKKFIDFWLGIFAEIKANLRVNSWPIASKFNADSCKNNS